MDTRALTSLVDKYRATVRLRDHLAFYQNIPTLDEAIETAALAIMANGKRHPHQRRIPRRVLEEVKDRLLANKEELQQSTCFDEIVAVVYKSSVRGFGELARYDTALRIGVRLGHLPTRVYLHAGTRTGAKALGLAAGREYLNISELPPPLHALQPDEIEDFLCIFKGALENPVADSAIPASCLPKGDSTQREIVPERSPCVGQTLHCD